MMGLLRWSGLGILEALSSKGKVLMNLWDVKHAHPRSQAGDFSAVHRPEAPKFRGVLASRASEGLLCMAERESA